jgi:hyaluronoglucosaminidase
VQTNIMPGVIEGFFGKTWDWPARNSGTEFLRDNGYQFYIYAPKADAYLRRRWREPMPAESLQHLSELKGRCRDSGISFGIGLTPFEIYLNYDSGAQSALRSKVRQINEIGANMLCILFDDMRGDVDGLAGLQSKVISDVCAWSTAESFIACPTYYSYDARLAREFGPPPKTYLRDLGRIVDARIDFFWTGEKVISDGYSAAHLREVAADIGRLPFIWDNHISNDSRVRTNHLFLDPSAGSWSLPVDRVAGLAINPMNQPYLSRIALCGYRHLLAQANPAPASESGRRQVLSEICRNLCGQPLAQRLLADLGWLQNTGLAQFDTQLHRRLLNSYEAEKSNPYAQEIAAWLRGEYRFDPQCLTT